MPHAVTEEELHQSWNLPSIQIQSDVTDDIQQCRLCAAASSDTDWNI